MTFEHFWLKESTKGLRPALWNEQCARHAWNAAVQACEAIVADKHDPCEPWLDPGDLTARLEAEVQT